MLRRHGTLEIHQVNCAGHWKRWMLVLLILREEPHVETVTVLSPTQGIATRRRRRLRRKKNGQPDEDLPLLKELPPYQQVPTRWPSSCRRSCIGRDACCVAPMGAVVVVIRRG